ncbi:FtsX-like permease family protein [Candidatus Falkowbacteria bacterium]|uniref:Multidrug ABC transporter substrate-binding protein n=1 Tax=Candidatus Buchananbacteria bacterium CG10_big_fil_rev_8_21_14_0_10_33_19 TaxID=1974525 RepID=A0A2H0W3H1_9BACT|nr:FtsX-like permease family protein [Candidatus Falkowbacteria bacterium]PIS05913.1 MAG: multidrug ABC transporter substrate-binding protein [Candidatus Buchananbacteria bacterium CG10_big_fil_rev_8_21_14_0_10_33_19]
MTLIDGIKLSFSVLRSNKIRSFLTSLGIIIGIAAVIIIISVGAGAQSLIINQLNSVGTNLVGVLPGASDENGPPASVFGIVVTTLKYEDAVAIKKQVPNVVAVSSYNSGVSTITYQSNSVDANFNGVMSDYLNVEDTELLLGRFFTAEEENSNVREVVLGYEVYQDLFSGDDPLGKRIKIKKETFEVIGVMKERGTAGFQSQDNIVLIPVSTAQKIMLGVDYVNYIRVKINDTNNLDRATEDIKFLLRDRHDIRIDGTDDFSVRNTKDAIDTLLTVTDALKFFLAAIAAISLVVGGVGVMNIMLAAVTERVREIGLRKAVGARRSHIIIQFVLETMAITLIGGIIGIILGVIISAVIAFVANYLGYSWDFVVSFSSILLSTGVSAGIGLIFGIYPAQKAAKLDPIEALRYE